MLMVNHLYHWGREKTSSAVGAPERIDDGKLVVELN